MYDQVQEEHGHVCVSPSFAVIIRTTTCFLQTESPLLIRPMIDHMTNSELHAVMVGGFATIAGSVMATYILFGVSTSVVYSDLYKIP